MSERAVAVVVMSVCLLTTTASGFYQGEAVQVVEAADLENRPDLIGREVLVDDHVAFYVVRSEVSR